MAVALAPQASVAATMPHCLVHATRPVQIHLLSAGVERASDLAGWFATEEEVGEYAARYGWLGADLQGLVLAWAEAGRPQVAARPNVPVPWVTAPRPPAAWVPRREGEPVSFEELVPVHSQPQPDLTPLRLRLQKFFFVLGEAGDLWEPEAERARGTRPAVSPPSGGIRLTAWSDAAVHDRLVAYLDNVCPPSSSTWRS